MYGRKSKPLCHNMSHRYTTEYTAVWWKHGCFFFINLSVGGWYLCVKRWRFIVFMFFWPFNFVKAHFHPQFFLFLWRSNTSIPHYNHSIGSSREMDNSSTSGIESLVEDWEFESPLGRWSFARNVIYQQQRSYLAYWGTHQIQTDSKKWWFYCWRFRSGELCVGFGRSFFVICRDL